MIANPITMRCPECYQECGWCSWYAMNARESGCGCKHGPDGKRRPGCTKAEALKGTKCGTCDGSGAVLADIRTNGRTST